MDDHLQESVMVENALVDAPSSRRVSIIQSPYLNLFYKHHPVRLTIDTGATTNMVKASFARYIQLPITPASQMGRQADGVTPLNVVGEVHANFTRSNSFFQLDALVVDQLDVDILAGNPFLVANDVATRPAKKQIVIKGSEVIHYGPSQATTASSIRRTQAHLLRSPSRQTVLLPGEYVEVTTPVECEPDTTWALEPRFDSPVSHTFKSSKTWPPPQEVESIDHSIRISNTTEDPIMLRRGEHFSQIRQVASVPDIQPEKSQNSI
jgi:hypothetical protein